MHQAQKFVPGSKSSCFLIRSVNDMKKQILNSSSSQVIELGEDFRVEPTNTASFPSRLRMIIRDQPQRTCAKKWDISHGALTSYLNGGTEPNRAVLERIAQIEQVRIEWLVTGAGPMRADGDELVAEPTMVRLRYVDARASAGRGAILFGEPATETMAFDARFLAEISVKSTSAVVLRVVGDSAAPTISDGALVIIDTDRTAPRDGGLYVLRVGDELLLKRLQPLVGGGLRLLSDNPAYSPEDVAEGDLARVVILGRVAWPPVPPRR
jgi:phage repressor protein C with HTH and peptisase S24 domain